MEERGNLSDHSLKLRDRRIGTVTGVQDIKSFDDKERTDSQMTQTSSCRQTQNHIKAEISIIIPASPGKDIQCTSYPVQNVLCI